MANDKPPRDDLNAQMQRAAEQMRQQTRSAIDGYFGFLRQSMASIPSGGTDLGEKLKAAAEKSIADTHQFMTEVSQAKDFGELMSLQSEFMQAQIKEFSKHLQGFGEAYAKSAGGGLNSQRPTKPPRE
jgi:hypothetical protein